jgi:hypothetical protein
MLVHQTNCRFAASTVGITGGVFAGFKGAFLSQSLNVERGIPRATEAPETPPNLTTARFALMMMFIIYSPHAFPATWQ